MKTIATLLKATLLFSLLYYGNYHILLRQIYEFI